jgi:hypothetical protein
LFICFSSLLSYNVVSSTPLHERILTRNLSDDRH